MRMIIAMLLACWISLAQGQDEWTQDMEREHGIAMTCINTAELTFHVAQEKLYKSESLKFYVEQTSEGMSIEAMQVFYGQYQTAKKWVDSKTFSTAKGFSTAMMQECVDGLLKASGTPRTQVTSDYLNGFYDFLGTIEEDVPLETK